MRRYEAQLEDGTRILSQRYGEGWSEAEAWGHFCHAVWKRARAAGSATVIMGDRYGTCLKLEVGDAGTMLGARRLPGTFRLGG